VSIATVIVTVCLAAMFSFSGIVELRGGPRSLAIRGHLEISPTRWRVIGLAVATTVLQST
jgi:hypothetical protein